MIASIQRIDKIDPIPHTSGIYCIMCNITGKTYIGSALYMRKRLQSHFSDLQLNKHHSILLQRAFNKYQSNNFSIFVLEHVMDKKKLLGREQFYLDLYKSYLPKNGFNISKIAGSPLGCTRSESTRKLLSHAHKGQKAWNKGLTKKTDERVLRNAINVSKRYKEKYSNEGYISPSKGSHQSIVLNKLHSKFMKGRYVGNKNPGYINITRFKLKKFLHKYNAKTVSTIFKCSYGTILNRAKEFWSKTPKELMDYE